MYAGGEYSKDKFLFCNSFKVKFFLNHVEILLYYISCHFKIILGFGSLLHFFFFFFSGPESELLFDDRSQSLELV